ncbi:MAG: 50S ribosomal protein L23 [Eubacteriales bacterium]|nr:50S ribosomal protein L23 [Eubacteriales bacterium]
MRASEIIIRPLITEKSMDSVASKRYTFEVMKKATKPDIAAAVEEMFGVKVAKVNTMIVPAKQKRVGVHLGKTSEWKKAIVTLKEDSKTISFFDSLN